MTTRSMGRAAELEVEAVAREAETEWGSISITFTDKQGSSQAASRPSQALSERKVSANNRPSCR